MPIPGVRSPLRATSPLRSPLQSPPRGLLDGEGCGTPVRGSPVRGPPTQTVCSAAWEASPERKSLGHLTMLLTSLPVTPKFPTLVPGLPQSQLGDFALKRSMVGSTLAASPRSLRFGILGEQADVFPDGKVPVVAATMAASPICRDGRFVCSPWRAGAGTSVSPSPPTVLSARYSGEDAAEAPAAMVAATSPLPSSAVALHQLPLEASKSGTMVSKREPTSPIREPRPSWPSPVVITESSEVAQFTARGSVGHRRCRTYGAGDTSSFFAASPAAVCQSLPAPGQLARTAVHPVEVAGVGHRRTRSDGAQGVVTGCLAEVASSARIGGCIESSKEQRAIQFPPEAAGWTQFELDLFRLSEGEYHPNAMASLRRVRPRAVLLAGTGACHEVPGRVSIVSPTMSSRQHYHEQLWSCFEAQTWQDKELIVVETYDESPSVFLQKKAQEDPRLVHLCFKRRRDADFSVGLKRDMTLHLASGSFVVNFDDDDIYAATYVDEMVGEMQAKGLVALTLSSWYNYIIPRQVCAYSDPDSYEDWDEEELEEVLYGYGFSYVHKRAPALMFPYPDVEFAEDAPFLLKFKEVLGDDKVGLRRDTKGICMHIVHRANSTGVDGESISHTLRRNELDNLAVATLPVFQRYLDMHATSWWHLLPVFTWRLSFLSPSRGAEVGSPLERQTKIACS